jgi:hypothetical protein
MGASPLPPAPNAMLHGIPTAFRRAALALLAPVLAAAALLLASPNALAVQASVPSPGDWFEESATLGFRVRVPKDWRFIPPQPNDKVSVALYVPTGRTYVPLKGTAEYAIGGWVTCFDVPTMRRNFEKDILERLEGLGAKKVEISPESRAEIEKNLNIDSMLLRWVSTSTNQARNWRLAEKSETKSGRVTIEERIYEGDFAWRQPSGDVDTFPVRMYVALLPITADRWGAIAFNAPGDPKIWKKHEAGFKRFARTLQVTGPTAEAAAATGDPRADRRNDLEVRLKQMPGWWMKETPNYFIVTDSKDKKFIDELADRLEAIRAVYEVDYPYTKARRFEDGPNPRARNAKPPTGPTRPPPTGDDEEGEEGEEGEEPEEEAEADDPNRTVAFVNSYEKSRSSVVRVCSDRQMYYSYGYWNWGTEELVVFDDKEVAGRSTTWAVVNHEAFHQYIFYFYGNISPHSWYNEGTGDFYSGYQYNARTKKFTLTPFDWRRSLARDTIRAKKYPPLSEWLRWSQREYYGSNDYELGGGENYALGWSFIWFLRTGKGKSKQWNPRWESILDTYLTTLGSTGDLDKAVDAAFEGVDLAELERAWTNFPL